MATNDFNTGRDCRVIVQHPLLPGQDVDFGLVTDFDAKPKSHDITRNHLDGFTRTQHIPQNVDLSWTIDRTSALVDNFCAALWSAYRTTGRVPDGQVYQYVRELDGSTTTTRYTGVAFKVDDLGTYKKEDAVQQKILGTAMDFGRVS